MNNFPIELPSLKMKLRELLKNTVIKIRFNNLKYRQEDRWDSNELQKWDYWTQSTVGRFPDKGRKDGILYYERGRTKIKFRKYQDCSREGKKRQTKVSIVKTLNFIIVRWMRKREKRSRQLKNWEKTCCIRSRRQKLIFLPWMMSSYRLQLVWLYCKIINWQPNLSINRSKLSNCYSKIIRWRIRLKLSREILKFTRK